jgi:hypothetical protein
MERLLGGKGLEKELSSGRSIASQGAGRHGRKSLHRRLSISIFHIKEGGKDESLC